MLLNILVHHCESQFNRICDYHSQKGRVEILKCNSHDKCLWPDNCLVCTGKHEDLPDMYLTLCNPSDLGIGYIENHFINSKLFDSPTIKHPPISTKSPIKDCTTGHVFVKI